MSTNINRCESITYDDHLGFPKRLIPDNGTLRAPRLLELFCGLGGWSRAFYSRGWECVGVDIEQHGYPFELLIADALSLRDSFLDSFDAVVMSPPCEDFARAWLPWLRGDHNPNSHDLRMLDWCVDRSQRTCRITECSRFAARHVPGAVLTDSWALWGDVPLLLPSLKRCKSRLSGKDKSLRALIPFHLAFTVETWFFSTLKAHQRVTQHKEG